MADEVPEHIKKFNKMHRKATAFANAIERHGRQAYDYAMGKHLRTEEGGIDLEKLEDEEVRNKVAKSMADFYVKKAKQQFKSEIPDDDEFKKSLLIKAYGQLTEDELKYHLGEHKSKFKFDKYQGAIGKMQEKIRGELGLIASRHINEDHIEDILKYTKTVDFLDKDKMTLEEAKGLLYQHKEGGVSPEMYKNQRFRKKEYYEAEKKAAA